MSLKLTKMHPREPRFRSALWRIQGTPLNLWKTDRDGSPSWHLWYEPDGPENRDQWSAWSKRNRETVYDTRWRTRREAIEHLEAVFYLDPPPGWEE